MGNKQLAEVLKKHVYILSSQIGDRNVFSYENLEKAVFYISEEFKDSGYKLDYQRYFCSGKEVKNIIAVKEGKTQEVIIVGAHYDTCFNPGADDNASSVAVMIELAKGFYSKELKHKFKFIAFVNEEPPFFRTEKMGSRVYAKEAKKSKEKIKAVVILEMVGYYIDIPHSQSFPPFLNLFYPHQGNFICIVGNRKSKKLAKRIHHSFKKTSFPAEIFVGPSIVVGVDFSDHWSFWKEGFSAVMLTDTAFYRNPYYHTEEDTYEKLNYEKMSQFLLALEKVLVDLDRQEI